MGVVRHTQIDWKLRVCYISKMYLDRNLIFRMCLGMHKYINIWFSPFLRMWSETPGNAYIPNIKSAICLGWIEFFTYG